MNHTPVKLLCRIFGHKLDEEFRKKHGWTGCKRCGNDEDYIRQLTKRGKGN